MFAACAKDEGVVEQVLVRCVQLQHENNVVLLRIACIAYSENRRGLA